MTHRKTPSARTLIAALKRSRGRIGATARDLGMHTRTLHRCLREHGIDNHDYWPDVPTGVEHLRVLSAQRRGKGTCNRCKDPVEPGHTRCRRHLDEAARQQRARKNKK